MSQDEKEEAGESPVDPEAAEKPTATEAKGESVAETSDELAASNEEWEGGKDDAAKAEKGLSPEAIQKRLEALGGESDEDRAAREEEERLAERRRANRAKGKGRGKSGLQSAASKRLSDIGSKGPVKKKKKTASPSYAASAGEFEGDALLETASQVNKWLKNNSKTVGIAAAIVAVVGLGFGANWYLQHKKDTAASTTLEEAVSDIGGRIGDATKDEDDERPKDNTPVFKTPADRQEAALSKFREVSAKYPGTGAAYLARLSEGSILLDKHDLPGAIAAFSDVKDSPLAKVDVEVHGRALEDLGFAYELKASDGDTASYNDALKTFRELENTDAMGFQELGEYHQARIYEKQGDKDHAKELLKKVYAEVTKPGEGHPFPYLENLTEDRLRALDPTALPPKKVGSLGGPAGNQMTEAQMRQLIERMKANQEHGGAGGGGGGGGGGGHP